MSTIQPIVGASLSSEALDMVVAAITSGEFLPGARLSEAELARRLGISRGPLREALGRLEGRLVTRTPRIGVRVIELSKQNIIDLFYAREALEGMGARLACERLSDNEIAKLRELLNTDRAQPEVAAGAAYSPRSLDDDFHLSIIKAAECDQIERLLMDQIYYQLRIHRRKSSTLPGRARAALVEHENIVMAMEARDPDQAEKAMRTHLRNARLSAMAAFE
ncbi:GntR family transcriptional regulator [Devosia sp. FJ2-5-3]|uniref:GntR family transcriptional regulator n=1 Tax=Devosia sp. FJ2-5-3 TaxID=2976680 RepID=UPI0023D7F80E|nr:GntR family transcriptional regulator [Devosia sp. FJ2-5-3]WEJ58792.1 GntR family transcriptional regulator [Devosia sp. FJ2-5-3]